MFQQFLPLLISFAATLVGITGNTWDKRKKGWRKLTVMGRLVVFLALASLAVASIQARQAVLDREAQEKKDDLLRDMAREDVLTAFDQIADPFKRLIDTARELQPELAKITPSEAVIESHLKRPSDSLEDIGTNGFLSALDDINALTCPRQLAENPGCTWAKLFGIAAVRGDDRLKEVAARYSSVLTPDALRLVQAVRSHKMLGILKSAPGNVAINQEIRSKDIDNVKIGWLLRGPHKSSEYYLPLPEDFVRECGRLGLEICIFNCRAFSNASSAVTR